MDVSIREISVIMVMTKQLFRFLRKKIEKDEHKRLLGNFISLAVMQAANYLLPLLTLPYLVRVLGPDYFGLVSFATVTIAYLQILTDYGFNLSATRQISINRGNKERVNEIFSAVMLVKASLMIVSFVLLLILLFFVPKFRKDAIVYLFTFGTVIGQVLFPVWFFQGMERMKYITVLNIIAKFIFTVAIFVFVREKSDYYIVPILVSCGFVTSGCLSLVIIRHRFKVIFRVPAWSVVKKQLAEGSYVFISNIAMSLYTVSTTFILGLFTNNTIVGYYSAGEKVIKAFQGMLQPITQTIYPYIGATVVKSREKGIAFIRKITGYVAMMTLCLSLILFVFAGYFTRFLLGHQYDNSTVVIRILAALPFVVGLSNIFGIQTMLNFNRKRAFSRILVSACVINLILAVSLVPNYGYIGSAVSVLVVEIFVTITMFVYLQRTGIRIIGGGNV